MSTAVPSNERPSLFAERPWDPATALGAWLGPSGPAAEEALEARAERLAAQALGPLAAALRLAPERERRRFELLFVWTEALLATAHEADGPAERAERLNRAAFLLARGLAGEPAAGAFLALLVAEARRRIRAQAARPPLRRARATAADPPTPQARAPRAGGGRRLLEALFGAPPTPAAADAGAGLVRLARLARLERHHAAGRSPLPAGELADPIRYRSEDEVGRAVTAECERLHPLLLRGARAVAEVPLSYRRPFVFLLPLSLELAAAIEERPLEVARRPPRLSSWSCRRAYWRARFAPLR
ncbi:MAG: hypothetical protein H6511_06340 [Holophagales bacterium]|nr:hypothetical protein [Holophagales bacterium]